MAGWHRMAERLLLGFGSWIVDMLDSGAAAAASSIDRGVSYWGLFAMLVSDGSIGRGEGHLGLGNRADVLPEYRMSLNKAGTVSRGGGKVCLSMSWCRIRFSTMTCFWLVVYGVQRAMLAHQTQIQAFSVCSPRLCRACRAIVSALYHRLASVMPMSSICEL